jgi:hypothetical protein
MNSMLCTNTLFVNYSYHKEGYVHTWEHQRMMHIQMVMVSDINRNRSGKWYGYGNSTCSAWLSYAHVNYVVASCSEIPVVTKFECVPYSGSGY